MRTGVKLLLVSDFTLPTFFDDEVVFEVVFVAAPPVAEVAPVAFEAVEWTERCSSTESLSVDC